MFRPAAWFIGLRYARAKTRNQFISMISLVSTLGIALGMTVLITVLSVVNGFDREIKKQIFDMIAPITINGYTGEISDWRHRQTEIKEMPGIAGVAPFVSKQAMLINGKTTLPVMLVGILPDEENQVSALPEKIISGHLADLKPAQNGIVIGQELARQLKIQVGEAMTIGILQDSDSTANITPHFKTFHVVGIFQAGGGAMHFDSKIAFIHLQDAQAVSHLQQSVSGFHVALQDVYAAPQIASLLENQLEGDLQIWNWTEQLGDFFDNIRMTKTMMFFIFVLIIAVAVFNLVCTMIMVVKNKQTDIAILRTLGATPSTILAIFLVQGAAIAFGGIMLGVAGGILLASNISSISTWLQRIFHTELISAQVYFVNYLPSEIQWPDVWMISLAALILSLIAAIYPALHASRLDPVEVLNSE